MRKPKRPPSAKPRPGEDLLAKPGMEKLADFTKKILKVPKETVDRHKPKPA